MAIMNESKTPASVCSVCGNEIIRHHTEQGCVELRNWIEEVLTSSANPQQNITELRAEISSLRTHAEKLAGAYDKYTALLIEELQDVVGLAAAHGWKSSRYEAGEQCRKEIAELKSQLNKQAKV